MENNNEKETEWISISEMADLLHISKQTVYNRVKEQLYESKTFRRGKMVGILVKKPKDV